MLCIFYHIFVKSPWKENLCDEGWDQTVDMVEGFHQKRKPS